MTTTAVVVIGNSDDKLTQREWADFIKGMDNLTWVLEGTQVHGRWFSGQDTPYQNAAWCVEIKEEHLPTMYAELARLARLFSQDSIAVVVNQAHMVVADADSEGRRVGP